MKIGTAMSSRSAWRRWLLAAVIVMSPVVLQAQTDAETRAAADPAVMARYRAALDDYNRAHQLYAAAAGAYWSAITDKRKLRNGKRARSEALSVNDYVLDQPPVYTGPPKPRNPLQPEAPEKRAYVPVVADFLQAAQQEFKFTPRQPQNDGEFKRAYARVASAAGLSREQAVRIYSFEATGNGNYDVEAGLEYNKHGRAITTALGYNQLLATNSVEGRRRKRRSLRCCAACYGGAIVARATPGAGS